MARKGLTALIEDYCNSENEVNIAFGIRPSGKIHLGNMMTMALAVGLSRDIGPHLTRLNITTCDLDLPDPVEWNTSKKGFARHYKDLPGPNGNDESMAQYATNNVTEFLKVLSESGRLQYSIRTLTEVQREPDFREGLKRVLDDPESMKTLMPHHLKQGVLVYPLCRKCGTSYTGTQKGKANTYEDGTIHTFCTNPDCDVEDYDVDVLDSSIDLAVHLFIDPLRDAVVRPYANIHVFGGDYLADHGTNKIPKINKIEKIMEIASKGQRVPDFLIGPTVYSREGPKMSKTKDNGLNITHLRSHLGEQYPEKVLDFTLGVVRGGYNHIDYAKIHKELLMAD